MKRLSIALIVVMVLTFVTPALAVYTISYDSAFHDGLIRFYDEATKKYGYMDTEGNVVIKAQYALADDFFNGNAVVSKKNPPETMIINTRGEVVLKTPNQNYVFETSLIQGALTAHVREIKNGRLDYKGFVLINEKGKVITSKPLMFVFPFDENGLALVGEGNMPKSGATITSSGNVYYMATWNGNTPVYAASRYYFIDRNGKRTWRGNPPRVFSGVSGDDVDVDRVPVVSRGKVEVVSIDERRVDQFPDWNGLSLGHRQGDGLGRVVQCLLAGHIECDQKSVVVALVVIQMQIVEAVSRTNRIVVVHGDLQVVVLAGDLVVARSDFQLGDRLFHPGLARVDHFRVFHHGQREGLLFRLVRIVPVGFLGWRYLHSAPIVELVGTVVKDKILPVVVGRIVTVLERSHLDVDVLEVNRRVFCIGFQVRQRVEVELHLDTGILGNFRVGLGTGHPPSSPGDCVGGESLRSQHDIVRFKSEFCGIASFELACGSSRRSCRRSTGCP